MTRARRVVSDTGPLITLEKLPDGGVRLVCSSGTGANKIRTQLRRHIIKGDVRRALFRSTSPLW